MTNRPTELNTQHKGSVYTHTSLNWAQLHGLYDWEWLVQTRSSKKFLNSNDQQATQTSSPTGSNWHFVCQIHVWTLSTHRHCCSKFVRSNSRTTLLWKSLNKFEREVDSTKLQSVYMKFRMKHAAKITTVIHEFNFTHRQSEIFQTASRSNRPTFKPLLPDWTLDYLVQRWRLNIAVEILTDQP